jgi:2-keto-3-deoxy-L-rhamnonate aldolase RhmA
MNAAELRRRLLAGETVFGTLIVSPSPRWPDAVRRCGLDFVFIDTEHIALDRAPLSWMCQTYSALGLPPLVRIPSPDPFAATMVLDGGAAGVVAPYVETAQQVRDLRGAVKFRPIKGQRLRQMLDGAPVEPELESYLDTNQRPVADRQHRERPGHRRAGRNPGRSGPGRRADRSARSDLQPGTA